MKKAKSFSKFFVHLVLILLVLLWVFPLVFTAFNSFKTQTEYNLNNFWDFPKGNALGENIAYIQTNAGIFDGMYNSLLYSFLGALLAVGIALLAAYAIAKLDIKRPMLWFLVIYSGTIFPFQVYLIPIFSGYSALGLYNTKLGMILFYTAICIPFSMFVLRNFFIGVSNEICEGAHIDGANSLQTLVYILLPMAQAPVAVVFLTQFSFCWNDLMFGITFTKSASARTIMASLSLMGTRNIPALLLACLIGSLPVIVMFIILQKRFETGFVYTGK